MNVFVDQKKGFLNKIFKKPLYKLFSFD